MHIQIDKSGTAAGLGAALSLVAGNKAVKGIVILSCDGNQLTPADVDPILRGCDIPIVGGIFPEILIDKEKLTLGSIVAGITTRPEIAIIGGLSNTSLDYDDLLDEALPDLADAKTMLVFVDGLATRIGSLITSLFEVFGLELNFIGGGAGSLSFEQGPCLMTNQGLIQDSAVLALLDIESGIGVQHGWQSIDGPFKVTESSGTVIKSLNWEPAFQVYKRVVEAASGQTFSDDNFFDIAKGYPFGINKLGAEKIVRDPIVVDENNGLVCVGEVPTECYVDILKGDRESLVNAAASALEGGLTNYTGNGGPRTHLFIDCISRVLFLQDEFSHELDAVYDQQTPTIGALTLGEIANNGKSYLEFYNKTAVLGVLGA